jgi:hypothetical protein
VKILKICRVYDDRTDETLFKSEDVSGCIEFIDKNYDEEHEDFPHVWIESFEMN